MLRQQESKGHVVQMLLQEYQVHPAKDIMRIKFVPRCATKAVCTELAALSREPIERHAACFRPRSILDVTVNADNG